MVTSSNVFCLLVGFGEKMLWCSCFTLFYCDGGEERQDVGSFSWHANDSPLIGLPHRTVIKPIQPAERLREKENERKTEIGLRTEREREPLGFLGFWWLNSERTATSTSIFLNLLMQAIEVEEHFHIQHGYATPRDLSYLKKNSTKRFHAEGHL